MTNIVFRIIFIIAVIAVFIYSSIFTADLVKDMAILSRHHLINLAIMGTFLSLLSLAYILRKNHYITLGSFGWWLNGHVVVGALGIFLLLVHSQYQFNALVPTINTSLLIIIGITGLFGWHLYITTQNSLLSQIKNMEDAEEYIISRMASTAYRLWRFVHIFASIAVLSLTIVHILSLIIFRGQY